jgi:hypothetical protein
MKLRVIKTTPERFVEFLQGKPAKVAPHLPQDMELLDVKVDLAARQVVIVVRSESFTDVPESYPIPEININNEAAKPVASPSATLLSQPKPTAVVSKPASQPSKNALKMENEFSPDQRKLLSFSVKGDVVVVKPVAFLKAEWDDINEVVRSLGGKWVKGDIVSYWEIPVP